MSVAVGQNCGSSSEESSSSSSPLLKKRNYKEATSPAGKVKLLFCQFCRREFKSHNGFAQHMSRHQPPGGYLCRYCDASHCTKEALTEHVQENHAVFRCAICQSYFEKIDDYTAHIETVHEGRQTIYDQICESCGQKFRSQYALNIHLQSKCGTKRSFKCDECGSNYMSKTTLAAHKLIHTGEKFFCCSYCGKRFISNGQLTVHERKHTKEKPFQCEVCKKSFSYRESLVTHSSLHTGIKPYVCECCGSTFSCVGNLQKHRRARPYSCGMPQYCQRLKRVVPRLSTKLANKPQIKKVVKRLPETSKNLQIKNEQEVDYLKNEADSEQVSGDDQDTIEQDDQDHDDSYENDKLSTESDVEIESPVTVEILNIEPLKEEIDRENVLDMDQMDELFIPDDGNDEQSPYDSSAQDPISEFEGTIIEEIPTVRNTDDLKLTDTVIYEIIKKHGSDIIVEEYITEEGDSKIDSDDETDQTVLELIVTSSNDSVTIEEVGKEESHKCQLCPLDFNEPKLLIDHLTDVHQAADDDIEKHFDSSNTEIKCPHCDKTFRLNLLYTRHLETHDPNYRKNCCKTKAELVQLYDSKIGFVCEKCGRSFSSRFVLKEHEKSKCGTKPIYTCDVCNKNYHSAGSLKTHKTVHTGALPFLCSYCGKGFRTRGQHKVHVRKHNGEKPFKCHLCTKAFPYRQSLITHVSTHTGEKPFQCQCGQSFSCVKNLISHRNTFKMTCGTLPKITKSAIQIGVIKGQLWWKSS